MVKRSRKKRAGDEFGVRQNLFPLGRFVHGIVGVTVKKLFPVMGAKGTEIELMNMPQGQSIKLDGGPQTVGR